MSVLTAVPGPAAAPGLATVTAVRPTPGSAPPRPRPGLRAPFLLLAAIAAAACGGAEPRGDTGPAPAPATPTWPDSADDAAGATPEAPPPPLDPAPWTAAPVPPHTVPAVYLEAWQEADNRDWCAPLALQGPPPGPENVAASPRTARFGSGWGVAYDLPELRSAFGVAGTGVEPGPDTYDDWPHHREWQDGSRAGYGPEGGRGPKQLAYLRVTGERCLYNVWSRLGRAHLEELLEALRRVDLSPVSAGTYSQRNSVP